MTMVQNHFVVNVAKVQRNPDGTRKFNWNKTELSYSHYFDFDINTPVPEAAYPIFQEIKEKFSAPDYEVTIRRIDCSGTDVTREATDFKAK